MFAFEPNSKLPPLTLATCRSIGKTFKDISIRSRASNNQSTKRTSESAKITESEFNLYSWYQERNRSLENKQLILFKVKQKPRKTYTSEVSQSAEKIKQNFLNVFAQLSILLQTALAKTNSELIALSENLQCKWMAAMTYFLFILSKVKLFHKKSAFKL